VVADFGDGLAPARDVPEVMASRSRNFRRLLRSPIVFDCFESELSWYLVLYFLNLKVRL
jgi:hypothetical protein